MHVDMSLSSENFSVIEHKGLERLFNHILLIIKSKIL
jgi:hypothetical protein